MRDASLLTTGGFSFPLVRDTDTDLAPFGRFADGRLMDEFLIVRLSGQGWLCTGG